MLKFSVSDIRLALKCPRMFYLCKKKKARSYPYVGEFTGSLVHDTLKDSMQVIADPKKYMKLFGAYTAVDYDDIQTTIENLLYAKYRQILQRRVKKLRSVRQIERGWKLIRGSKDKIAELIRKTLTRFPPEEVPSNLVLGVEKSIRTDLELHGTKFRISGRIDLLLNDPETNKIVVWDYKTGGPESIDLDSIQLALYAFGLEQEYGSDIEANIIYMMEDGVRESPIPKYQELKPIFFDLLGKMKTWYLEKPKRRTVLDEQCQACHLREQCFAYFDGIKPPDVVLKELQRRVQITPVKTRSLCLGNELVSDELLNLVPTSLTRHATILGASGSGKTVLGKVIIEELFSLGIPVIAIDPQGDISSLILPASEAGKTLLEKTNIKIFSPGSRKVCNLTLDPFALAPLDENISPEDYFEFESSVLTDISETLLHLLNLDPIKAKSEKAFLEALIKELWRSGESPTFRMVAEQITQLDEITSIEGEERIAVDALISKRKRTNLAHGLMAFAIGTDGIFFRTGSLLDLDALLRGEYGAYIIHLGGVGTDLKKRQMVLSWIIRKIYDWMLRNPPKDESIRLLFYIDEVADFLPRHPHNPSSKKMLMMLLRQARKYGVGCVLATQSPGDIEYRAMDNTSTLFLGKILTRQSVEKVMNMVEPKLRRSGMDLRTVIDKMMTANAGEFILVPLEGDSKQFKVRWLHTEHKPLALDTIAEVLGE